MVNMVVLKRLREKKVKSKYINHIATTIKSQKWELARIYEAENFCPISLVIKPLAKRIVLIPFFFLFLSKNDYSKDSVIVTSYRYERGDVSLLS